MKDFPEFILASRSPQRSDLLRRAGYRFAVLPPPLPEPGMFAHAPTPAQLAEALAYFKARSVRQDHPDRIVVAADTVVAVEGEILGKAGDAAEARRMLGRLSGTRHSVTTGLALLVPPGPEGEERRLLAAETTFVTLRRLSEDQINQYVASGEWRDKAGAYAIQETGDAFVERLEGDLTNVVGLPLGLLEHMLRKAGDLLSEPKG